MGESVNGTMKRASIIMEIGNLPDNFFKIQWNLAWRQRTPPGHPPVQTVAEGKEDSAKEGKPSHTACICPGQKFSGWK